MRVEERGYYSDPETSVFEAKVIRAEPAGDGTTRVWLDRTFFYPLSGGQPDDRGTLGGLEILSVTEEDSTVCHLVRGTLDEGDQVEGRIEMARRRYHMQQHSGQHLLSRVIVDYAGYPTVGFHLGESTSTIDIDTASLPEGFIEEVEKKVNGMIAANMPISGRIIGRDEYASLQDSAGAGTRLRSRLPEEAEHIRIVEIGGIDSSTCCGTHCRSTGEIGLLKILGTEKVRTGTRIEFVCGLRAVEDYSGKHDVVTSAARRFSADWKELDRLVEKMIEENRSLRRDNSRLQSELSRSSASGLAEPTSKIGDLLVVKRIIDASDPGSLRAMASTIREQGNRIVLLGATGDSPAVVFACSQGVDLDMADLLRKAAALMGARGGGSRDFAQGGGGDPARLKAALDEAERLAREAAG